MYLRALNNGLIVLEPSIEFLSVDNLPKVVGVSCCRNMFSYEIDLMSQTISSAQSNINNLPIVVESNIDLPIVVEPIEAQKKRDLPNVVEPIEAQNKSDLPIAVLLITARDCPGTARDCPGKHNVIYYRVRHRGVARSGAGGPGPSWRNCGPPLGKFA
jgi:hypothetical protein